MPLSSGSTLQQTDEVAAVAPGTSSSGGAVGGGPGGTIERPGELGSFRPGLVPADAILFSHILRNAVQVEDLLVFAGAAPTQDYTITIEVGSASQTATVPSGSSQETFSVGEEGAAGEEIRVTGQPTADDTFEDVRCSFTVLPA